MKRGRGSDHPLLLQAFLNGKTGGDRAEILLGAYSLKALEDVITQLCESDGDALPFELPRQHT